MMGEGIEGAGRVSGTGAGKTRSTAPVERVNVSR